MKKIARKMEKKNLKKIERIFCKHLQKNDVITINVDGDNFHKVKQNGHVKWLYEQPKGLAFYSFNNGDIKDLTVISDDSARFTPELIGSRVDCRMSASKIKKFYDHVTTDGTVVI